MKKLSAAILFVFVLLTAEVTGTGVVEVTVKVEGFKSNKGYCRLLVYENEKGFPEDPDTSILISSLEIKDKRTEFSFMIPPGTYAISILHDENSNEKLDKTWYGKPKEGFGISNNPKIWFGPPKFEEAAVKIDAENIDFQIKLIYL
ncbi:MAG: DUF2141 domain-containing protein [Candidatus Delongbacteria bacterium]